MDTLLVGKGQFGRGTGHVEREQKMLKAGKFVKDWDLSKMGTGYVRKVPARSFCRDMTLVQTVLSWKTVPKMGIWRRVWKKLP
jgi:hypothetical protein